MDWTTARPHSKHRAPPPSTSPCRQLGNGVIDGSYNSRRLQERLGLLSPIEFEEKHCADQATVEQANLIPRQTLLPS